ncbi:uncharacterized protein DS421_18g627700 [Arachis hypogaea]|nr:uncharacterized protein DS421_18g627700 [Arachis hypogaea]
MMTCDHPIPPDRYDERVEEHLRSTGFYHVSQIGVVQCQKALVNALVERWHPDTHTFHLSIGECAVSLEDVAMIFGIPTEGLPVTGMTLSSFEALEAKCLHQFGVAPRKSDCRGSGIKTDVATGFKRTSGASVHWKYLPLLSDFASIGQYSWGSACLAHLYRSLCRASRFDCKEIDGPLTLLLCWAWMRLPYLAPVPREPRNFSLANRWRNWERGDRVYRYHKLAHFRKALDELQEGQFLWVAYSGDRVDPDIISAEIYMHSVIWSATVSLVSFECIEWHATDRFRRQFSFVQRVPHQERSLDRAHGEVLTGPKNLNWATATTHSFWDVEGDQVMDDDNEEQEPQSPPPPTPPPPPPPAAEEQPHSTSQYVPQIQFPTSFPIHQPHFDSGEGGSFSKLLGFMASDAGQAQYSHQADFMAGRYSFDARYPFYTYSGASGGFVSGDSSRSDGGRGVLNSQNPNRVSMTMIEENAKTCEHETAEYLVDEPDDEEDDEDEDEDMEEEDEEDEESRNDRGDTCTPGETGKGYNLRIDPPRRSASRYTPSVIKKAAKKCKNIVNFGKWTVRK